VLRIRWNAAEISPSNAAASKQRLQVSDDQDGRDRDASALHRGLASDLYQSLFIP
jgi:hypothetical protein